MPIVSQIKKSTGNWKNRWQIYLKVVQNCFKYLFSQTKEKNVMQIHFLPKRICVLECRVENQKKIFCFSQKCCLSNTFLHFSDKNRRWAEVFLYTIYNVGLVYSKEPQAQEQPGCRCSHLTMWSPIFCAVIHCVCFLLFFIRLDIQICSTNSDSLMLFLQGHFCTNGVCQIWPCFLPLSCLVIHFSFSTVCILSSLNFVIMFISEFFLSIFMGLY